MLKPLPELYIYNYAAIHVLMFLFCLIIIIGFLLALLLVCCGSVWEGSSSSEPTRRANTYCCSRQLQDSTSQQSGIINSVYNCVNSTCVQYNHRTVENGTIKHYIIIQES